MKKQGDQTACGKTSVCRSKRKFNISWLPTIVVALLPKCPLCILAYGGAMTLCSGSTIDAYGSSATNLIFLYAASAMVLLSLFLNNRGVRTKVALAIVGLSITLLILTQNSVITDHNVYYLSLVMLFLGVWINGSFIYILNSIISFKQYLKPSLKK